MLRQTRILMGMPITVEIVRHDRADELIDRVFQNFAAVEARFSVYRADSEVSQLNQGRLAREAISAELADVLEIARRTSAETDGYFDIRRPDGSIDPSGIVKGWAILKAARLVAAAGAMDFLIDAGGDIQTGGVDAEGGDWILGIRNPFDETGIIKAIEPRGHGVATSGTYVRGNHIRNPHAPGRPITDLVSLTVIGADVLEADRFATAAFAMGGAGIHFIERTPGLEAYAVDATGVATLTSGFGAYVVA